MEHIGKVLYSEVMMDRVGLIFIILAFTCGSSQSFLFTKDKVDCLMSQWGEWSEVFGFGARSKERVILRYPDNGGKPCPNDTEITERTCKLHAFVIIRSLG